jgi:5,10-methylene-tetrahydrofolate dehydrogenase/methenyl tetrahydrofolate cyclohydrolase
MKTNLVSLPVSLLLFAAITTVALAQDDSNSDNTAYEASDANTVVYDAPATYYASVVYQSAVIYNAPVYYIGATVATVTSCEAQEQCRQQAAAASTVTVIGAHGGVYTYSNQPMTACNNSTVVQFGERGGWFGGRW